MADKRVLQEQFETEDKRGRHAPRTNAVALPNGAMTTNYTHTQLERPSINEIQAVPDKLRVPGLNFVLLSCASYGQSGREDNACYGAKIRGAFDTKEEAEAHALLLQKEDKNFDIYVASMYEWLVMPPSTDLCEDVHISNQMLEEIMNRELQFRHKSINALEDRIQQAKDDLNTQDMETEL